MNTVPAPSLRLKNLAATALIGTDRLGAAAGPEKLLSEAALAGAQRRAGRRPALAGGQASRCPADLRPFVGTAPAATLARLLSDPELLLIEEWAGMAHSRGMRVPDEMVPTLLDWWARQPTRAAVVFEVLGKRGEWLASLNPAWKKPVAASEVPQNADEIWQTGKASERVALLTTVRRTEPGRALAMVQTTWASDGADERARFINTLSERCSMADEPFLEAALDDRSKTVKAAAASVLGRLAGSRLRKRMGDAARAIIKVERKGILKRGVKVVLEPPKQFEKAWERDGIVEEASSNKGKKAWWMRQILEATELGVWQEVTGLDPQGVVAAVAGDDFAQEALLAMSVSAGTAGDRDWCTALADALAAVPKVPWQQYSQLWQGLPRADREDLALRVAERIKEAPEERWLLIAAVEAPWSSAFSVAALKMLKAQGVSKRRDLWINWNAVETVSYAIDPSAIDAFEAAIAAASPDEPTPSIKKSIDRVRLRAEMHKEFAA